MTAPQRGLRCPHCGQEVPEVRFGVRLTAIKARIFDFVRRGGDSGACTETVAWAMFGDTSPDRQAAGRCLKSHIHQINELIGEKGWRIVSRLGVLTMRRTRR